MQALLLLSYLILGSAETHFTLVLPRKASSAMTFFLENPQRLSEFRAGDRRVLAEVYRHYVRTVDAYLRRLARSVGEFELCQPSVVADLIQDVFVRAFSSAARSGYDGVRPFSSYLRTIARHRFIDMLRVRQREALAELTDDQFILADDSPCDGYEPKVLGILTAYIQSLPPLLRGVYEERFVHGRSQEATAACLGLSRRKLRTSEERLRRDLRKALQREGLLHTDAAATVVCFPDLRRAL